MHEPSSRNLSTATASRPSTWRGLCALLSAACLLSLCPRSNADTPLSLGEESSAPDGAEDGGRAASSPAATPIDWVADLGHVEWERRETAQRRLLADGAAALPGLAEAAQSTDPELSWRARQIRQKLDPLLGSFEIVRVRLEPRVEVVEYARTAGAAGESLRLEGLRVDASRSTPFELTWNSSRQSLASEGQTGAAIRVRVSEVIGGSTQTLELTDPLPWAPAWSLVKTAEETRYRRREVVDERQRQPILTLLGQRLVRSSNGDGAVPPPSASSKAAGKLPDSAATLARLDGALAKQAREGLDAASRQQALVLLASLGTASAETSLETALADESLRATALWGLARVRWRHLVGNDETLAAALERRAEVRRTPLWADLHELVVSAEEPGSDEGDESDGEETEGTTRPPQPGAGAQVTGDRLGDIRLRAAAQLGRQADPDGWRFLLRRLAEKDISKTFFVLAELADAATWLRRLPTTLDATTPDLDMDLEQRASLEELLAFRDEFLDRCVDPETISQAPWSYFEYETEHFVVQLIALLEHLGDRERTRTLLATIQDLLVGQHEPLRVSLDSTLPLWRRAAQLLEDEQDAGESNPASELELIRSLLPRLRGTLTLSEAVAWFRNTQDNETVPDEFLSAWVDALLRLHGEGDETQASTVSRRAVELSKVLRVGPGQLPQVVRLLTTLVARTEEATSKTSQTPDLPKQPSVVSARKILPSIYLELARWTGIERRVGQDSVESDLATWTTWLADADQVAAREAELIAAAEQSSDGEPAYRLWYFEVEIESPPSKSRVPVGLTADSSAESPTVRTLDGFVASVSPSQPYRIRCASGRIERGRLSSVGSTTRRPPMFRLNGSSTLVVGSIKKVTASGIGRGERWYETSSSYLRARYISRRSATRRTSLFLLEPLTVAASEGDVEEPAPIDGSLPLAELWTAFVERHLLDWREDLPLPEINARLRLLGELRLPAALPALEKRLASQPSIEVAKLLMQRGRAAGTEYLIEQLSRPTTQEQLLAARPLAESGNVDGARALLRIARKDPTAFQRQAHALIGSLDKFLQQAPDDNPLREEVVAFIFESLDVRTAQYSAFKVVQRLAGSDFGYAASRTSRPGTGVGTVAQRNAARQKAIADAVEAARGWWSENRQSE